MDYKLPCGYSSKLSLRDTETAIKIVKDTFEQKLAAALNLQRVTAPILVRSGSGINDDLNGVERKVEFTMKEVEGSAEIVQSLAKWKRAALHRYGFEHGEGLYTDMNAIRRDDDADNIHSIFVDQWDWELIIDEKERCREFLYATVQKISDAIADTHEAVSAVFPVLSAKSERKVFFITSQELEDMYPDKTSKERENLITKEHRTVFITQIGWPLSSGSKHDGRAPDYDDWTLNGDLLVWDDTLGIALELSSMGIRVNEVSLMKQLEFCNETSRLKYDYHKNIISGEFPLTVGGGIGQSRLCMFMLEKAHVGEVQSSVWPERVAKYCKENNITLL